MGKSFNTGRLGNGLFTDANGNVGIGTTSPGYLLDVVGTIRTDGTSNGIYLRNGFTASITNPTVNDRTIAFSTSNEVMRLTNSGNVGIGTTNANDKFVVQSSANVWAAKFIANTTTNDAFGVQIFAGTTSSDTAFRILNAATTSTYLFVRGDGNVGIGTSSPEGLLHVGGSGSSAVTTPTSIVMDGTYRAGSEAFDKLKFYLYKSSTETYGLGLGGSADVQYWAGTTTTGKHRFFTSQTERVTIIANGNVGIGTSSPSSKLGVKATGAEGIVLEQDLSDASNSGRLFFLSTTQNYGVLNNAGDLRFTYGAQPANTSGTSLARFTNTGKYFRMESGTGGIQFQGTTSSSNALNYYEQGTWTPILSGSNGGDYTAAGGNSGKYTRIGNVVTITCTLVWSGGGAYSGNLCVRGIPFTNGGNRCHGSMGAIAGGLSLSSGYYFWSFLIDPGYNFVYIIQNSTSYYSHGASVSSSGTVYAMTLTYLI